ncbi:unnamed protein product [Ectocarpus sp. CCAP 1310/34]|nr:unnamed protein product [Ectocarpus sp. CCAP 1310/34]
MVKEFMKFGGKGMIQLMVLLYNWVWKNEYTPTRWREGVVVNLRKKGDKTDPGNYRGITLLNTVGNVFCKLLNDRIVGVLEQEHSISEGQAGFRKKRGCVDHAFMGGRIIQGRKRARKPTYCFFLDVKKAYDTVWRNGLILGTTAAPGPAGPPAPQESGAGDAGDGAPSSTFAEIMPGDTPTSDSGGTTIDSRVTELSKRLEEQSKVFMSVMEKLGQLQMPPARAAGAEEGESSGAGNAAGRGGAALGTRFEVPPGGVGGVGLPGHPSAAPPLGSKAQGV